MRSWAVVMLCLSVACSGAEKTVEAPTPPPKPATPPPAAQAEIVPLALPADANPLLLHPSDLKETAPAEFQVKVETTKGAFVVKVHREWAPNGADRFYNLAKVGFYDQARFFRAIEGFMVQFGISGYPEVAKAWMDARIPDDDVTQHNTRGMVTFATAGPNTRTTQLFINLVDNSKLDAMGFAPFGEVVEGMDVVDSLYMGYGEGAPRGRGPHQGKLQDLGNAYLDAKFPKLDGIVKITIE
ncbi:MAG: peptidylprolyl isomerase [Myxococcales bacterium]|nr:peptidylprolyl isomerase [Myxococcales bacterium]